MSIKYLSTHFLKCLREYQKSEIGVKTVSFWQQKFEQNTAFH